MTLHWEFCSSGLFAERCILVSSAACLICVGNIYGYGLPLDSGLIGGWGAMPVENPAGVVCTERIHSYNLV